MNCDFCHAENPIPAFQIHCRTFDVTDVVPMTELVTSKGDWIACVACHQLVETDDRVGLYVRSFSACMERFSELAKHSQWVDAAGQELRQLHLQFWENRIR